MVKWTKQDVERHLTFAVDVERKLPLGHRRFSKAEEHDSLVARMIDGKDYLKYAKLRKGAAVALEKPRSVERPSPRDIDDMMEICRWFQFLSKHKNKEMGVRVQILWHFSLGLGEREVACVVGKPPRTCRNWYNESVEGLMKQLSLRGISKRM